MAWFPPSPRLGLVRAGEEGVDLRRRQVANGRLVGPLRWDGEHPGDRRGVFGMAQGSEPEQRMDGGEAGVAGAGADMADDLQVIEEGTDAVGVEVGKVEARRLDSRGLLEVAEQEP